MTSLMRRRSDKKQLMPVLYLPHGAGPMPLLGLAGHRELAIFLKNVHTQLPTPKAVLVISAHWESDIAAISSSPNPTMLYDYGGFPAECYDYQYPAPGEPQLAQTVADCLQSYGIESRLDPNRGYDHGAFVPLMLMYPDADIPVVQLSLLHSLDPAEHIALGRAITSLREQGILIIGSGMSFHERTGSFEDSLAFDNWLTETVVSRSVEEAENRLMYWELAPSARACHQREEHLLPLHVCFGAAISQNISTERIYSGSLFGRRISGFLWR